VIKFEKRDNLKLAENGHYNSIYKDL